MVVVVKGEDLPLLDALASHLGVSRQHALSVALEIVDGMRARRRLEIPKSGWLRRVLWFGPTREALLESGWKLLRSDAALPEGHEEFYGPTGLTSGRRLYIGRWHRPRVVKKVRIRGDRLERVYG